MPAHTGLCKHIPVTVVHGPIIMMLTSCATAKLEAKPSLEADSEGFSKSDLFRALGGRSAPTMEIMYCVLWVMLMSQKAETAANTRVTNASQQLRRKNDSFVGAVTVAGTGIRQFVPSNSPPASIRALRFAPIAKTPPHEDTGCRTNGRFRRELGRGPDIWRREIQPVGDIGGSMIASVSRSRITNAGCVRLPSVRTPLQQAYR